MKQQIIDTDQLEKVLNKYEGTNGWASALCEDLRQLLANSPQADGMVLESLIDHVCLKAAEIHNLGKFVSDTDAQNVINEIRAMLSAYKPQADDVRKDAWISVKDRLPEVPKGEYRHFTVAILRKHDNKTYSMPAVYLNEMELTNAYTYDDEIYTGWHEAKEHYEFEEYYSKIEYEGGDKVTHWQPLPAPPLDKARE